MAFRDSFPFGFRIREGSHNLFSRFHSWSDIERGITIDGAQIITVADLVRHLQDDVFQHKYGIPLVREMKKLEYWGRGVVPANRRRLTINFYRKGFEKTKENRIEKWDLEVHAQLVVQFELIADKELKDEIVRNHPKETRKSATMGNIWLKLHGYTVDG